jgi:DNA-directed RNA polymerase specialized sigma24 family protein
VSELGSVSVWIHQLQAGDREAVQRLWEVYFTRLVGLARRKLQGGPRSAADEEDIALSAFDSFCRRAEQGLFPQLADRDDLWEILVMMTECKAWDHLAHEGRQKRDWRRVQQDGPAAAEDGPEPLLVSVLGREPDPAFAAEVAEQCRWLLDRLGDEELQHIAVRKLEGHTNDEIAGELDCAPATVGRRLRLIRKTWEAIGEGEET